jgi:hypothetical protein
MRKNYDSRFKSKVAIEAIKGEKTIAQIELRQSSVRNSGS